MIRPHPRARSSNGPPVPSGRGRLAALFGLITASSLCIFAACALCVPGFVFGAEAPAAGRGAQAALDQDIGAARPAGTPLVTLPWGSGPGEVGLAQPTEGLTRGPEALTIAPDGRIAILDSVNRRVVFLDSQGHPTGTTAVSLTEPRFLAVDDQRLYVLDCDADRQIETLGWDGASFGTVLLPELSDVVTGLFATSAGPCIEIAHDGAFLVASPVVAAASASFGDAQPARAESVRASLRAIPGRPLDRSVGRAAKVSFAPGQKARIKFFAVDAGTLKGRQSADVMMELAPGRTVEHLVSVDGDGAGGLIVGARLLDSGSGGGGRDSLILVSLPPGVGDAAPNGASRAADRARRAILLADSPFAYLGQPYVVAPDGRIFQPVGSDAGYSILVYSFAQAETPGTQEEVQP